jgi:hypothetical protein
MNIGAITVIEWCHSRCANQPSGITVEACDQQKRV